MTDDAGSRKQGKRGAQAKNGAGRQTAELGKIAARIEREAGLPGLTAILAEKIAPTDLQSILMEVYRRRAARRTPAEVLADYEANRFVRPAKINPGRLAEWERVSLAQAEPEFEALILSPVCPLGACSAIAAIDQNWAVATARNTEVVSDCTNVLALEGALRRRKLTRSDPKSPTPVHLTTCHRLLRPQDYQNPAFSSHFSVFALCSAGRDTGGLSFELAAIALHARTYIHALRSFFGADIRLRLAVSDFAADDRRRALIERRLLTPIRTDFENTVCKFNDLRTGGRGYYRDLCFKIHAQTPSEPDFELADGGLVDWTQRLLGNAKERLVISGIGSDRVCAARDAAAAAVE